MINFDKKPNESFPRRTGETSSISHHMSLVCAAVISPTNAPVHVQTFGAVGHHDDESADHAVQQTLHCSLDAVDDLLGRIDRSSIASASGGSGAAVAATGRGPKDSYLGPVFQTEDHQVYAWVTNTRARLMLVYEERIGAEPNADAVRAAFKTMHDAYADAMSDPFASREGRIESAKFTRRVAALATGA